MQQAQVHMQPAPVMAPVAVQQMQFPQQKTLPKHHKTFYTLGIIEVVIASICLVSGIILVSLPYSHYSVSYIGTAIWATLPLHVTGGLGICSKNSKSRCLVIAAMVMAIITSLFMVILLGFSITGAITTSGYYHYNSAATAFHSINAMLSFAAFVIVIIHSAFCCRDTCCGAQGANARYGYVASTQQVIQLPNGQGMVIVQGAPGASIAAPNNTPGVQYNFVQSPIGMNPQLPAYTSAPMVYPSTSIGGMPNALQQAPEETKVPLPDNERTTPPPEYQLQEAPGGAHGGAV